MSGERTGRGLESDPFAQFNFLVDLGDGRRAGFQEMSGLDESTPRTDYRVSRDPTFSDQKMPGLAAIRPLTLKRGLIDGGDGFREWCEAIALGRSEPRTIRVEMRGPERETVATWALVGALPTHVAGGDGSAARHVAIESLEIVCESVATGI